MCHDGNQYDNKASFESYAMRQATSKRPTSHGLTRLPAFKDCVEYIVPSERNAGQNESQTNGRDNRFSERDAQRGSNECNGENLVQDGLKRASGSGSHEEIAMAEASN